MLYIVHIKLNEETMTKSEFWESWNKFRDNITTLDQTTAENYFERYLSKLAILYEGDELTRHTDNLKKQFDYLVKQTVKPVDDNTPWVRFMDGREFEEWCADLLISNGFINVKGTPASGDQGVDITAQKDDVKYAFQCKNDGSRQNCCSGINSRRRNCAKRSNRKRIDDNSCFCI